MSHRFIAHLDMDAFYASVELLRYPALRGRPLVIGGRRRSADADTEDIPTLRSYTGRGVITTATYEARALGVNSGMGLMKAAKLAPDALLLPADFDEYRRYSRLFKEAVRGICPHVEDRGIDEIYIDLTELVALSRARNSFCSDAVGRARRVDHAADVADPGSAAVDPDALRSALCDDWMRARAIAASIQRAVRDATGLSCSIGVTPNKLLSKIASELDKPLGLTVVRHAEIAARIWPLAARKINGIGPKANERLEALGIRTIGELASAAPQMLIEHFGRSYGAWMHDAAHGRDERPVVTYSEPKSISRETTFENDLHPVRDRERLSAIFSELCVKVAADLDRKGYVGKTIGLKLRYDNFRTVTRDCTLEEATRDPRVIRRAAGLCLKRVALDRRLRLLGVRVGALSRPGAQVVSRLTAAPRAVATLFD
jgi:DNA polymerase IV